MSTPPQIVDQPAPVVTAETPTGKPEPLPTQTEVADLFRVDPKTVARWAAAGKIPSFRTPGGHRRYRQSDVHGLLEGLPSGEVTR